MLKKPTVLFLSHAHFPSASSYCLYAKFEDESPFRSKAQYFLSSLLSDSVLVHRSNPSSSSSFSQSFLTTYLHEGFALQAVFAFSKFEKESLILSVHSQIVVPSNSNFTYSASAWKRIEKEKHY